MNLSAPKMTTFVASLVIALVGLLAYLVDIPALSPYAFWILLLGLVVLAAGVMIDGISTLYLYFNLSLYQQRLMVEVAGA